MPGGHALSAHDSGGLKRLQRVCVSSLGLAHKNIMKEDMLGLQGRKKEAQVGAFFFFFFSQEANRLLHVVLQAKVNEYDGGIPGCGSLG